MVHLGNDDELPFVHGFIKHRKEVIPNCLNAFSGSMYDKLGKVSVKHFL